MTHLTDLQLSMHADNALASDEASTVAAHLAICEVCLGKLDAAKRETGLLSVALNADPLHETSALEVPKFSRPAGLREFAMANLLTGLAIWLVQFLWKTLFGEVVVNAASWVTSVYLPGTYELVSATALYYLREGTAMFDAYFGLIAVSLSTLTAVSLLLMYRKSRAAASLGVLVFMGATAVAPVPAHALEIRRDDAVVTVSEAETIDDTLLVAGDTVVIKGTVTGDLVAVGRRIDINGTVKGNLLAFGESVTVEGNVGGLVLSAGSTVELTRVEVGGDFWGAGDKLTVDDQARVAGNVTLAGQNATVEGSVAKDLYTFAEIVELSGAVGRDLEAFVNRVRLLDGAHISGNARLHMQNEEMFDRAASALVDGEVEFLGLPEGFEQKSRYASTDFYLWQLARLASAVLLGLALIWLFPSFRNVSVSGGVDGLKTAGIGLAAVLTVPTLAVLVAITLVGLPFSFLALVGWMVAIYMAKIVVGLFVGRVLLGTTKYADSMPRILLAGMAAIIVAINIPAIGGFVSFLLTILGVGVIVQRLLASFAARNASPTGAA